MIQKNEYEINVGDYWNGKLITGKERTLGGRTILHFDNGTEKAFAPGTQFLVEENIVINIAGIAKSDETE